MLVTKCDFLNIIIAETEAKREADKAKLNMLFEEHAGNTSGVMNYSQFTELIQSLDNSILDQ